MHIALMVRNYNKISKILRDGLPTDKVVEYNANEVSSALSEADVVIPIVTKIAGNQLRNSRVKLIQQYGAGLDSIDLEGASKNNIPVANVPAGGTGNAESVAELAITFMIMLSRNLSLTMDRFKQGKFGSSVGDCIWRRNVLILGYGAIGKEIAKRLSAFGVNITAVSRKIHSQTTKESKFVPYRHLSIEDIEIALPKTDFLIVAATGRPENNDLVDENMLQKIKKGAYIINVARGPVINYDALFNGLRSNHIAGAGLDVFWNEPFNPKDPILKENIIATPHIGGATITGLMGIGKKVIKNINLIRDGHLPKYCVNVNSIRSLLTMKNF